MDSIEDEQSRKKAGTVGKQEARFPRWYQRAEFLTAITAITGLLAALGTLWAANEAKKSAEESRRSNEIVREQWGEEKKIRDIELAMRRPYFYTENWQIIEEPTTGTYTFSKSQLPVVVKTQRLAVTLKNVGVHPAGRVRFLYALMDDEGLKGAVGGSRRDWQVDDLPSGGSRWVDSRSSFPLQATPHYVAFRFAYTDRITGAYYDDQTWYLRKDSRDGGKERPDRSRQWMLVAVQVYERDKILEFLKTRKPDFFARIDESLSDDRE